jgi:anti-anti-sigma factor
MSQGIEVATRKKDDVSLIDIKGDVTAVTGEQIEQAYQRVCADAAQKIVLCFDPSDYINSGGIAVVIGIVAESKEKGQIVRVTGLSPHFQKIFDMVGLTKYAEIFPSESAALERF